MYMANSAFRLQYSVVMELHIDAESGTSNFSFIRLIFVYCFTADLSFRPYDN